MYFVAGLFAVSLDKAFESSASLGSVFAPCLDSGFCFLALRSISYLEKQHMS